MEVNSKAIERNCHELGKEAEEFVSQIMADEEDSSIDTKRCGLERTNRVCVIGDGAAWIWNIVQENFWNAIQIVDIYHAREHYWNCARIVFGTNSQSQRQWAGSRQEELDSGDAEAVIRALRKLRVKNEESKKMIDSTVGYFKQNKKRMRYNVFRAQGLFVGSGVIEAGCRSVIGLRLKQSGMHWTVSGANSIIAFRCCLLSRRWEDFWTFRAAA
ncbi:MAG: hypothetical protein ACYCVH_10075 [Ignavibacteriaceae bacterium]